MNKLKQFGQSLARGVVKVGDTIRHNGKTFLVIGISAAGSLLCQAQTDATVIATNAQTAFGTIAPITITIAGFYLILKIAKRVVS